MAPRSTLVVLGALALGVGGLAWAGGEAQAPVWEQVWLSNRDEGGTTRGCWARHDGAEGVCVVCRDGEMVDDGMVEHETASACRSLATFQPKEGADCAFSVVRFDSSESAVANLARARFTSVARDFARAIQGEETTCFTLGADEEARELVLSPEEDAALRKEIDAAGGLDPNGLRWDGLSYDERLLRRRLSAAVYDGDPNPPVGFETSLWFDPWEPDRDLLGEAERLRTDFDRRPGVCPRTTMFAGHFDELRRLALSAEDSPGVDVTPFTTPSRPGAMCLAGAGAAVSFSCADASTCRFAGVEGLPDGCFTYARTRQRVGSAVAEVWEPTANNCVGGGAIFRAFRMVPLGYGVLLAIAEPRDAEEDASRAADFERELTLARRANRKDQLKRLEHYLATGEGEWTRQRSVSNTPEAIRQRKRLFDAAYTARVTELSRTPEGRAALETDGVLEIMGWIEVKLPVPPKLKDSFWWATLYMP